MSGMGEVIGDLLPMAIGVAISPIPIIAVILMLLSKQAARTGSGFLIGWLAGIVVVTVVVLLLVGQAGNSSAGKPSTVSSVIKLVLGALLLVMALKQWRSRPKPGETATMPKWMAAIDSFTFVKALGLAFLLSAINPKNLILCVAAGTTIGAAQLSGAEDAVAVVVFTVIAASFGGGARHRLSVRAAADGRAAGSTARLAHPEQCGGDVRRAAGAWHGDRRQGHRRTFGVTGAHLRR